MGKLVGLLVELLVAQACPIENRRGPFRGPISRAFQKLMERLARNGNGPGRFFAVAGQPGSLFQEAGRLAGKLTPGAVFAVGKTFNGPVDSLMSL